MRLTSTADFGAYVAEQRELQGLTQAQLARKAHVTRDWLARFETSARDVTLRRVVHVLNALGVTITATTDRADDDD